VPHANNKMRAMKSPSFFLKRAHQPDEKICLTLTR